MPKTNVTPDFLEEREFYDVMQAYRHSSLLNQESVTRAYENVQKHIRAHINGMAQKIAHLEEQLEEYTRSLVDCPNCRGSGEVDYVSFKGRRILKKRCSACRGKGKI